MEWHAGTWHVWHACGLYLEVEDNLSDQQEKTEFKSDVWLLSYGWHAQSLIWHGMLEHGMSGWNMYASRMDPPSQEKNGFRF